MVGGSWTTTFGNDSRMLANDNYRKLVGEDSRQKVLAIIFYGKLTDKHTIYFSKNCFKYLYIHKPRVSFQNIF